MQKRLVAQMADLLEQANFTRVDPANVHFILTKDSAYGLDLEVDLDAFEEVLIYYRGATTITERRRDVQQGLHALEGGAASRCSSACACCSSSSPSTCACAR